MKVPCHRCGGTYDRRFYAQHRVTEPHTVSVLFKQVRYGGPTNICLLCSQPVRPGEYKTHRTERAHLQSVNYGRERIMREEAIQLIGLRDNFIATRIRDGASYGGIARELGISRQRVHQIARGMGMHSQPNKLLATSRKKECFYDSEPFVDWATHEATSTHQAAMTQFVTKVSAWRRGPGRE